MRRLAEVMSQVWELGVYGSSLGIVVLGFHGL